MTIANEAIYHASRGWQIVQLYGVVRPGVCSCWKGADCGTPGKHPVEAAWPEYATSDEEKIASWFDGPDARNIGIMLGPRSGVIDVEIDDDVAKQAWNDLNLGEIYTPTYTSGRGPHRLFKWTDDLPRENVKKPLGIEIRLGGRNGSQSVLPPSTHHTGNRYEWVPGLSPDDVPVAPLPDRLKALLWNDDGTTTSIARVPANQLLHKPVEEGDRNNTLHRFAVREAFRSPLIDDPTEQQDLLLKIRMANAMQVKPPLGEHEVATIFRSACDYVRKSRAAGMSQSDAIERAEAPESVRRTEQSTTPIRTWQRVYTATGLAFTPLSDGWDPEWMPGEWRLTVVHSDPLEYRLHVPAWCRWTANGTGNVTLTVDQFRSATKVASTVLASTGTVMLDDEPGKWRKIWDGGESIAEGRDADGKPRRTHKSRGMKAKLLDNAGHEWPGASSLRYVVLAGWLYDRISQASHPNDEDTPDSTGRASWRKDGTLWFNWTRVWEDMERSHKIEQGERLSLKRRLLAKIGDESKDFKHAEFKHPGGSRKSYVVWTAREVAILEEIATENPVPRTTDAEDSQTDRISGERQND